MVYFMEFYVDGGCRRNGYPEAFGAAACVQVLRGRKMRAWTQRLPENSYPSPTSQRAELTAMILALETAFLSYRELVSNPSLNVTIHSDSRYAVDCMTTWIYRWSQNGWRNSLGQEVANLDLIQKASNLDDELRALGSVNYIWIPRSQNEPADRSCKQVLVEMEEEDQQYSFL